MAITRCDAAGTTRTHSGDHAGCETDTPVTTDAMPADAGLELTARQRRILDQVGETVDTHSVSEPDPGQTELMAAYGLIGEEPTDLSEEEQALLGQGAFIGGNLLTDIQANHTEMRDKVLPNLGQI
jgi:hypothetical protein